MRVERIERALVAALFLLLTLQLTACRDDGKTEVCGQGEAVVVGDAGLCVYEQAIVIETGFKCPRERPHRYDRENCTVCSDRELTESELREADEAYRAEHGEDAVVDSDDGDVLDLVPDVADAPDLEPLSNNFQLSSNALPLATAPEATRGTWSFAVAEGLPFAAFESPSPGQLVVERVDTGESLASFVGHHPFLMASPSHGLVLFYIDHDGALNQDELYARSVALDGTLGEPLCKGCEEEEEGEGATLGGPVESFDASYSCSTDNTYRGWDEGNSTWLSRCNDGMDNDNDGVADLADEGCESDTDDSEADCSFGVTFVRGDHRARTARIYDPSLHTLENGIGGLLHNMNLDTDVTKVRADRAYLYQSTAWIGVAPEGLVVLELVSGQDSHRYFPYYRVEVAKGDVSSSTDFDVLDLSTYDDVVGAKSESVIAWASGDQVMVRGYQPNTQIGSKSLYPIYDAVSLSPATLGESVSNIELVALRSNRALLTYEVQSGVDTVIEVALIDLDTGELLGRAGAIPGARPHLVHGDFGTYLGYLRSPTTQEPLASDAAVTPGYAEVVFDAP